MGFWRVGVGSGQRLNFQWVSLSSVTISCLILKVITAQDCTLLLLQMSYQLSFRVICFLSRISPFVSQAQMFESLPLFCQCEQSKNSFSLVVKEIRIIVTLKLGISHEIQTYSIALKTVRALVLRMHSFRPICLWLSPRCPFYMGHTFSTPPLSPAPSLPRHPWIQPSRFYDLGIFLLSWIGLHLLRT